MEALPSAFEWQVDDLPETAGPYVAVVVDCEPAVAAGLVRAIRAKNWIVSLCSGVPAELLDSVDADVDLVVVATTGIDWSIDARLALEIRVALDDRVLVALAPAVVPEHALERLLDAGYDDVFLTGATDGSFAMHLAVIGRRLAQRRRDEHVDSASLSSMLVLDEFVEHLPCGAYESTPFGRFLWVNEAMVDLLGYASKDDLLAIDIPRDLYRDPSAREGFLAAIDATDVATGHELRFRRTDGNELVLLDHAYARRDGAGRVVSYVGTLSDITGRIRDLRRAEDRATDLDSRVRQRTAELLQVNLELRSRVEEAEAARRRLQQSEERYSRLIEDLSDGIFQLDPDGRVTYASPGLIQKLGIDDPAHGNRTIADFVHRDDLPDRTRHHQQLLRGERVTSEFRLVARDGHIRHVICTSSPLIRDGRCTKIQGVVTDVTDLRTVQRELAITESVYRGAIEAVPAGVVIADAGTEDTRMMNSSMAEILGMPPGAALCEFSAQELMMAIRFWSPSGREYEFDALPLNRALRTGEVVRDEELVFERVDGSQRIMIVNAAPIRDRDGRITAAVAVGSDITEKRDLEARVRRAETLEAMGRLAGAVAHDFNNLIMVVLGAAHLLTQRYASTSEAHGELEMITRSARSAADLSRSLLAFSRRQVLHREVLSVDAVIAATLPLVDRMVGDNIAICHTRADAETPVLADQASVERILVNLCMNARDAMPCGGQIEIECRRVDVDLATTECCPWMRPGEYIRLAVRDTGTGMDKATVGRALDPFFTTKDADKGTGLGLTSVYGTAKQHGGFIAIDSEPGVGTEVSVFLPCTDVDAPVPSRDRGGGGAVEKLTVLVAEDREDLLEIMCRFLEDLGHTVIPATNGGEALAMLEASNGTIDVVVTDVAMPVLGGLELRATCRQRWPQIAFVLCSGYREGSGDQEPSDDLTVRLEKPFDVGDLDKRISQVVDAARRRAHSPVISTQPSLDSEDLA